MWGASALILPKDGPERCLNVLTGEIPGGALAEAPAEATGSLAEVLLRDGSGSAGSHPKIGAKGQKRPSVGAEAVTGVVSPRLDMVVLVVQDLSGVGAFYRDVVGLEVTRLDRTFALFRVGGLKLALQEAQPARLDSPAPVELAAPRPGGGAPVLVALAVDDADACYAALRERGAFLLREPADFPWGRREFALRDLDGHVLVIHGPPHGRPERLEPGATP